MFSNFLRSLLRSANASAKPFAVNFHGGTSSFSPEVSLLLPRLQLRVPVSVPTAHQPASQESPLGAPRHPLMHTSVHIVCRLNWSLVDFCHLSLLGKSFEVQDESLERLLPDTVHTFLGDLTPSPSKVLDVVIDGVILPEFHQCLFIVLLGCSNSVGKGPPQVGGLTSCCHSLVHHFD
ncbi:hypothetical protein mRhiFer1_009021 [Rhinolophus ferrumequinum]|uniref:Uncharacterized protein n=1 Tax=Rhinolophus ferrumequinum TaxID=59479 RepID=A0A7J7SXL7_RHIFE|nr:hypothetical protein mRhiFer1_009021 [Rhinolophus ferrumequinum]